MAAEKTESIILSVAPYRETSCILRLFTRSHGLVHGIAKGARRSGGKSTPTPLDRGLLLEALLYHRPNRELHTLGGLHVAKFFHGIRADITKSALRDVALELYLKSITEPSPHPELFELLFDFLDGLDGVDSVNTNNADNNATYNMSAAYLLLWRFIAEYCEHTGFGIDTENHAGSGIDSRIVNIIIEGNADGPRNRYSIGECINVTERLLLYCRRHFDIRTPFNSMEFIRGIITS
ncbi:MAG: DNA repair protein RecO [Chitinispirillales bacterium]|jgi:recombinational DNA repair protein (RecF pathway)|nr:DNA repair protein RecO [Chitinispirillales bacterium]